jgi:FkbM family methyltransferase
VGAGFDPARTRLLLDGLRTGRLTRVVDVGANPLGPAAYADLLAMGGCAVWGFEPQEAARAALVARKGPHETYLPHVVGAGGAAELRVTANSGFTSLLEPNRTVFEALGHFGPDARVMKRERVVTFRLDDIAEVPDFDLLKIDVQGGEAQVFAGARRGLAGASAVISEVAAVPLYEGQPLLDAQMSMLRQIGYHLHKFLFFKTIKFRRGVTTGRMPDRPYRSQLSDGDAVFVRGLLALEGVETERLKHLAILADAVFFSLDVAAMCLDELVRRGAVDVGLPDSYAALLPDVAPLGKKG